MDEVGAKLQIGDQSIEFPSVPAKVGNSGFDISKLRGDTRTVTFDPGFANTASARSTITYIDGTAGKLTHRGYAIEDLANSCGFLEVAFLLVFGHLPNKSELEEW